MSFFLFVEVFTEFIYSSPKFIELPFNQGFYSVSGCLSPFHLVILLQFCPVLFLFFHLRHVFSFGLTPCAISMLGRSAMSPNLGSVALCRRCPVGLSGVVSLVTWASAPLCGLCVSSCSCALIAFGTLVGEVDPQADWLWVLAITSRQSVCGGWPSHSGRQFSMALVPGESSLWVCCVDLVSCCSVVIWSWPLGVLAVAVCAQLGPVL